MFNPEFSIFDDWMFGKLNNLLSDKKPPKDSNQIFLNIGEPQLNPPDILKETINRYSSEWRKYTPSNGTRSFREAVSNYISRRYPSAANFLDIDNEITPVPGTRAPLYQIGSFFRNANINKNTSLVTNPFYHAWRAGATATGNNILWMNADFSSNWLPDISSIDSKTLKKSSIMYICTPTNPHGAIASLSWLAKVINLCRKNNILLCVDECYADIYRDENSPPPGTLEALKLLNDGTKGVVVLHSLSKRSSCPGLRAGFMAGDPKIIAMYRKLVANGGVVLSEPQLRAAEALYQDDSHVKISRDFYNKNFSLSETILKFQKPDAGFFHFIPVDNDLEATKHLWEHYGIKIMPGSFMSANTPKGNPSKGFLRIALVHNLKITKEALSKIARGLEDLKCHQ